MTTTTHEPRTGICIPPAPNNAQETGLEFGVLADLALKTVYSDGHCTTDRAADRLKLPMGLTQELLQHLFREKFIEIRGMAAFNNDKYGMLDRGYERAQRLLDMNGYIGPAPVSLAAYGEMVRRQGALRPAISPESVREVLESLVLSPGTMQTLGLVANSRRSLFMTGPSGNGKTSIAKALHNAQAGEVWIPYAIDVDGHFIKVFDAHNHQPVEDAIGERYDRRWVRIKPPLVIVGGEMTIETMDLVYSPTAKYYEAPFQVKANGGTLVIDDFGRQRIDPHDLLNRWIIPLEGKVDYLTLHTGKKIEVPFELLLVFATNLDPESLVDAAFLRRMGYRLSVTSPTKLEYAAIFRQVEEGHGFVFNPSHLDHLMKRYDREGRQLRGCEPRDLLQRAVDICAYTGRAKVMDADLLDLSWKNYFGTA